jgi:hypothetical protein
VLDGELAILRETAAFSPINLSEQPQIRQLLSKYDLRSVFDPMCKFSSYCDWGRGLRSTLTYDDIFNIAATENRLDMLLWLLGVTSRTMDPLTLITLAIRAEDRGNSVAADWLVSETDLRDRSLDSLVLYALLGGDLPLAKLLRRVSGVKLDRWHMQASIAGRNIRCIEYMKDELYDIQPAYIVQTAAYVGDVRTWDHCVSRIRWQYSHLDAFRVAGKYGNIGILQRLYDWGMVQVIDISIIREVANGHTRTREWLVKTGLLE